MSMRLVPNDDERDFAAALRRLFATAVDDPALWRSLSDIGVLGVALPERHGGADGALGALGVFCVEAGRHLCPTSVYGTVFAALALQALATDEQMDALAPGLGDGSVRAATALWSTADAGDVTPALTVRRRGTEWELSGRSEFVLDATTADDVFVTGRDEVDSRVRVFVVPTGSAGLRIDQLTLMGGQSAARLTFDRVALPHGVRVMGGQPDTVERLHRLANAAITLLSLDLVGVSEAALQRTVDHTVSRRQFGRPIASFQAAQHLVADMHIAVSAARLAAWAAIAALADGVDGDRQVAVARMHAATAAKHVTLDAHQLHGGMGYVVDTDLHRYSERARVLSTIGGGSDIAANWLAGART